MYRLRWFVQYAIEFLMRIIEFIHEVIADVVDGVVIEVVGVASPGLWSKLKLTGLAGFTLYCTWATVVVYNSPGAQASLLIRVVVTAWFGAYTAFSLLALIYYGRQQAKEDALMG